MARSALAAALLVVSSSVAVAQSASSGVPSPLTQAAKATVAGTAGGFTLTWAKAFPSTPVVQVSPESGSGGTGTSGSPVVCGLLPSTGVTTTTVTGYCVTITTNGVGAETSAPTAAGVIVNVLGSTKTQ